MALLHDRATEAVRNLLTAQDLLYTSYVYQGQFEGKTDRLVRATIYVGTALTQDSRERVVVDIAEGTTTPQQADLLRSIRAAEVVVDVVLKRPWSKRKRQQWQTQNHSYKEQLANVGIIRLNYRQY